MTSPHSLMVVLYVHDMDRAVAFWRDGVGQPVMTQSPGWSRVGPESGSIGLHLIEAGLEERPVAWAGPNFQVADLDAAVARAVEHGAILDAIREAQPRVPVRLGVLRDPDGNGFELRQPVAF
jgi:catechol 2,3-dioxygenase-like lactoylglutathione lyase family enzyme